MVCCNGLTMNHGMVWDLLGGELPTNPLGSLVQPGDFSGISRVN